MKSKNTFRKRVGANLLKHYFISIIFYCVLFLHSSAFANQSLKIEPLFISNILPIAQGLGLPSTLSATSLKQGEKRFDYNLGVKSNANDSGSSDGEILILDGETQSLQIGIRYGLTDSWQFDAQVAYLAHNEGYFDGLIQQWHEFFQLDEGDRPLLGQDEFLYYYERDDVSYSLNDPVSGWSDVRVGLAYEFQQNYLDGLLLRGALTLPTGEQANLTGSNEIDADVGLYMGNQSLGRWTDIAWHANLGYVMIGDDTAFGVQTRSGTWFASTGAQFRLNSLFAFKAQLDWHSAIFDSEIEELNKHATQLTLGLTYENTDNSIVTLYFSEDISVNRTADFSMGIEYKHGFK